MLTHQKIAFWFFRLNGFLQLENFLVHHELKGREGTECDILGVRFPFRKEYFLSGNPMEDHELFQTSTRTEVVIGEVKSGRCRVNAALLDPNRLNLNRILLALGLLPDNQFNRAVKALYTDQVFEIDTLRIRLFALGDKFNRDISNNIVQLSWDMVLRFIHRRFNEFERQKRQHDQWDETGRFLYERATEYDFDDFLEVVKQKLLHVQN